MNPFLEGGGSRSERGDGEDEGLEQAVVGREPKENRRRNLILSSQASPDMTLSLQAF